MGYSVLIVDDSTAMRKIIIRSLRQAGIEIADFREAGDGAEGLTALADANVDLILSDTNMPNMNGLDFVRAVHAQHESPPPIVMITTEGSDDVAEEAIRRGARACLKKPFTSARIQQVIEPFLR